LKRKSILGVILSLVFIGGLVFAQEQEKKITLPQLTPEQKISRLSWFQTNSSVFCISFAKAHGLTAEDIGKHMVAMWAGGWDVSKGSPIRLIQGVFRNADLDPTFKMEILSASETEVKGKMTVNGKASFAEGMYYGVSLAEHMRTGEVWMEGLAGYLGLVWKQNYDGEWINFTVSVKK
jgi:hypothetical protein